MSGHSKWATIRHKKGAADAKRGKLFSKFSKAIMTAVKEGGPDTDMNFALRLAIDKAKGANMPKDNIQRAIQRGQGISPTGAQLTEAVYEGMGPGGAAIIVEAQTDNPNRTITNLKTIFNKFGGNMDAQVKWMFERRGAVYVEDATGVEDKDAFELMLIDAGAEDIDRTGIRLSVISDLKDLSKVKAVVEDAGLEIEDAGIEYVPKEAAQLSAEDEVKLEEFIETLEEDDDVNSVYTNAA